MVFLGNKGIGQPLTKGKLDSLISETIAKHNIPSMAVAVIKQDSILYGIQGYNQINTSKKVQLTDKYHIGSNTKAFTSFLAFQAIEENRIGLETMFFDLYPNLKDIRKEYKEITLADLLSHNARVRPYTNGKEFKKLPSLKGSVSEKRYVFAKYVLQQKPVKKGEYSNAGYVLAAMMLEKVYDLSFESILKNSMDKLGFEVFYGFPNKQDMNYPWGHWMENDRQMPLPPNHEYKLENYMLPAGDLSINILDYSRFIQKHLKGVYGNNSTLKQESYEKLLYNIEPYSYGWSNQVSDDEKLAFHDGSTGTFYCHTLISSTYEFAIIIMMNCAQDEQEEGLYRLSMELFKLRNKSYY